METIKLSEVLQEMAKNDEKARIDIDATIEATRLISKMITVRIEKQLTQAQLAKIVGEKKSFIARVENMKVIPNGEQLLRMFLALGHRLSMIASIGATLGTKKFKHSKNNIKASKN